MNLNTYQAEARIFAIPTAQNYDYLLPGLAGEVGEFSQLIAKQVRDETPADKDKLIKELGDVLWFVALLADQVGTTLAEVAQVNVTKLASRKERSTIKGSGDDR